MVTMRLRLSLVANVFFTLLVSASNLSPFFSALDPWDEQLLSNETSHELLKRQSNACPTNYNACTNEGAPGLCCAKSQLCTADTRGYVACCPTGASCTGTITGIVTGGTLAGGIGATSTSGTLTSQVSAATTTTTNGLILASATATTATTTGGFIIAASTTVATLEGGGMKSLHIPMYAQLVIKALEYIPL